MKKSLADKPESDESVDLALLDEIGNDNGALATTSPISLGQVTGDVDSHDLVVPRIEIVQAVGPLSQDEERSFGEMVLNKSTVLTAIPAKQKDGSMLSSPPVNVTILSIAKSYEEVIPYDPQGKVRARTFSTLQEVHAADLWVDWRDNVKPPAREVATLTVLVEKPEGLNSACFHLEIDGKSYALAQWIVRSGAYTRVAKKIFSASQIELSQTGLVSGIWSVGVETTTSGGNRIAAPTMKLSGKHGKEQVQAITERLTNG